MPLNSKAYSRQEVMRGTKKVSSHNGKEKKELNPEGKYTRRLSNILPGSYKLLLEVNSCLVQEDEMQVEQTGKSD